eukprot:6203199-Pleurochrysis_carterae.AAC.6
MTLHICRRNGLPYCPRCFAAIDDSRRRSRRRRHYRQQDAATATAGVEGTARGSVAKIRGEVSKTVSGEAEWKIVSRFVREEV